MAGFVINQSKFLAQFKSQNLANNSNLSKYCLFNLFQICKFGLVEDEKLAEMKNRISEKTTPILSSRCQEILAKFSKDESRSGSIKLPQNRIAEVVFIL